MMKRLREITLLEIKVIMSVSTIENKKMTEESKSRVEALIPTIKMWISLSLNREDKEIFYALQDRMEGYCVKGAHNMKELKEHSTTEKGLLFEAFCLLYLRTLGYTVYHIKDLPKELGERLGLRGPDAGIDLVAYEEERKIYIAVQCKYRFVPRGGAKRSKYRPYGKVSIGWKELSTFYALVARTGSSTTRGWDKRLVMTTADYVSRKGKKDDLDWTIAKQTFVGLERSVWLQMAGSVGHKLNESVTSKVSEAGACLVVKKEIPLIQPKPLRELRSAFLDKILYKE